MDRQPLVSIITPTFNHESFIVPCLQSVQAQTYRNWEQIVIDDGSQDSTPSLIQRQEDSRLKYVQTEHGGISNLGNLYNRAFEMCEGELIAILEGDDAWPKRKLEVQVPFFRSGDVVLCWGNGGMIDRDGKRLGVLRSFRDSESVKVFAPSDLIERMLLTNVVAPSSGVMIRREALNRVGGFHQPAYSPFVDWPTWLALLVQMKSRERFLYANRLVAFWRQHPFQVSRTYRKMVEAGASLVAEFGGKYKERLSKSYEVDSAYLRSVIHYHKTWSALGNRDWKTALWSARTSWRVARPTMRAYLAVAMLVIMGQALGINLFPIAFETHRRLLWLYVAPHSPPRVTESAS